MAQVNVDLSEYDMLREAKKNAENEVIELKKEIEEYKKNARVIVTTKKCFRIIDSYTASKEAIKRLTELCNIAKIRKDHNEMLREAIEYGIKKSDTPNTYYPFNYSMDSSKDPFYMTSSSTEIKGFEDVRLKVEETLKAEVQQELNSKLLEAEESRKRYNEKYSRIEKTVAKEYQEKYSSSLFMLENENKRLSEELNKLNQDLNEERESYRKYKEETTHTENYKAAARNFELEVIALKKELEDTKHKLKVAQANSKKHWWNF